MTNGANQWYDSWRELVSNQPWQSVLNDWWREYSRPGEASPSTDVLEKIAAQSHSFFKLAEEISKAGTLQGGTADWQTGLNQMFDGLKQSFGDPSTTQAQNLFWQMPLANWQRTASSLSSFPGDFFSSAAGHPAFDAKTKLDEVLSAPGLGYTRESQVDLQMLARLSLDYQKAQQNYNEFFLKMSMESLESMHKRVLARMEEGKKPIASVRALYDLWVDCSEAVYGDRILTNEYAILNGSLVNALMALKKHSARITDEMAGMMNMPTRQEMDTVHHRFQVSRRAGKIIEQEIEALSAGKKDLMEQVNQLLARVAQLERGEPTPAVRIKAGSKKSATKKAGRKKAGKSKTGKSKAAKR